MKFQLHTLQVQSQLVESADDAATESWEATMAYDLGGGATFNLGTNQDETTFAGVGFSF